MAAVIIGTQGLGYDCGDRPRGEYVFEHAGALYAFLRQSILEGDRRVYVFRSSDDGATWTNLGANSYVTENEARYTIAHDGNTAYMLVLEANYSPGGSYVSGGSVPTILKLFTFDLPSHSWSSAIDFASGPGVFVDFEYNGNALFGHNVTTAFMRLLVRGPGDCVFFYSGSPSLSGGNQYSKLYARTFNGATFGTQQVLPSQDAATRYNGVGGCVDSAANCHLVYLNADNDNTVLHVGLTHLNAFGTVWLSPSVTGTIYFPNRGGTQGDISEPLAYSASGVEQIGFALWVGKGSGGTATQWIGFFHAPMALAPSFVYQEIIQENDNSSSLGGIQAAPAGSRSPNNQGFEILNTMFCLAKAVSSTGTDRLCIAWTNTQSEGGGTGARGYAQRLISSADTLVWTFDTPIVAGDFAENTYLPANAVLGLSGTEGYAIFLLSEESDNFLEEALVEFSRFAPAAPTISCGSPPDGKVGTPYSHAMPSTHTGTFTVAVTAGALPDGLTMDSAGVITGTPTAAGTFVYTATITDESGHRASGRTTYPGDIAQDFLGPDLGEVPMGQFSFTVGGAVYAFITNPQGATTSMKIAVYKSTDAGQTWTEVGAGSSPLIPVLPGSSEAVWTVARDGSSAIALWAEMQAGVPPAPWTVAHIGKAVFSFTSQSWSAQAQIANPGLDMRQSTVYPSTQAGATFTTLQLIVRSPGNYVLFYQGTCNVLSTPPNISRQARVSYSTFNGSTFGPEVQLPSQTSTNFYFMYGGCVDASGLITFLYTRELWPWTTGGSAVTMSCSLSAGNVLGTPVDIASDAVNTSSFFRAISTPVAYITGGVNHVAFAVYTMEGGSNTGVRVFDAPSTASPSWTNNLVTNDQTVQPAFPDYSYTFPYLMSLMSDGTNLAVVWEWISGDGDLAAYYYSTTPVGGAFTWTTPAPLWVPPVLDGDQSQGSQVNVQLTTGGFLVVGVSTSVHSSPGSVAVQAGFIPSGLPTGSDSVTCSITISAPTIGLGCASPPDGVVGVPYSHIFPVSGGAPPYTFAIISGILPVGLTLDSLNGQVSGTPTLAGDYEFTIQVSDDFGSTVGTCDIVITVTDLPASDIGCGSPPGGEIGAPYSHTFPVTDIPSGATVVYSITGGALPPGLTLNTSTGQVTGTPTTSGNYHFTITATIT